MRYRSPCSVVAALGVVALVGSLVGGCGVLAASGQEVNWEETVGRDLNCSDDVEQVGTTQWYDITGDREPEAFVILRCVTPGVRQPEASQLEVFNGASNASDPTLLAVPVRNSEGIRLEDCMYFSGNRVFLRGLHAGASWSGLARWDRASRQMDLNSTSGESMPACP